MFSLNVKHDTEIPQGRPPRLLQDAGGLGLQESYQ